MTQNCLDVMHQYGEYPDGNDIQQINLPDPPEDICAGDFLVSNTVNSALVAKVLNDLAWNTDLATTRVDAKAAFKGVALAEVDNGGCHDPQLMIPIARYKEHSKFTRSYAIKDANGADTTETWVRGQGFTFAKSVGENKLANTGLVKTSTANQIVFRAVKDSGSEALGRVEVEFAS